MALSQEEIDALDPRTRKMYDEVSALARERGLDTDTEEFWRGFIENFKVVVPRLVDHVDKYKRVEQRLARRSK